VKKLLSLTVAAAALTLTLPAMAQFAKGEDAIKYRQGVMKIMATHFGRIGAMAQGKMPFDAQTAQRDAEIAAFVSKLPATAFIDGSDKGETKAKPNIWTERAKFDAAMKKMQEEMANLDVAAKTGDLEKIKAAFGPVGQSCKACHDDFRAK
jgi:cytochrome c556